MGNFERAVWYLDIIAMLALIVRLASGGLLKRYRWFFSYLVASFVESAILAFVPFGTDNQAMIYMAGQAIRILLSILVVLELFKVALVSQPALAAFGRTAAVYVSGFALILAACGLAIDRSIPTGQSAILHRFYVMQRTADFSVAIMLLVITWFVMWFPVQVKSNVAVYTLGFVVYFLAEVAGLLVHNLLPYRFIRPVSAGMLSVSFLCLMTWLIGIRREGEERTTVVGHSRNPTAAAHLTKQLQGINDALGRFAKR